MVTLENVFKTYTTSHGRINALDSANLTVKKGEFVVVTGPSGSGKTTFLMAVAGMLRPTQGIVKVDGEDIYSMSPANRTMFRRQKMGFVFQMFHLIPYLNVVENTLLAGMQNSDHARLERALGILEHLGMTDRAYHRPAELSAGEKQRVAIARALYNKPKLLLADEPTGNLDPENAKAVLEYLAQYNSNGGTVIIVTHGKSAIEYADRVIDLQNGRIVHSADRARA